MATMPRSAVGAFTIFLLAGLVHKADGELKSKGLRVLCC